MMYCVKRVFRVLRQKTRRLLDLIHESFISLRKNGLSLTIKKIRNFLSVRIHRNGSSVSEEWLREHTYSEEELQSQKNTVFEKKVLFSILVPLYNTPERFLTDMLDSVLAQSYSGWELLIADGSDAHHISPEKICRDYQEKDPRIHYRKLPENKGISENTNACLEMASGEYVAVLDHDDILSPAALFRIMEVISEKDPDVIYTDEAVFTGPDMNSIRAIHFKPDFGIDSLRGNNYICHFTSVRKTLLQETGAFRMECDGSQDHDLILRLTEKTDKFAHIPEVLYYWRSHNDSTAMSVHNKSYSATAGCRAIQDHLNSAGIKASVESIRKGDTFYRIRYEIIGQPKVSIIIPTCDHIRYLNDCLRSIEEKTIYPNYEIILVENHSKQSKTFEYYEKAMKRWPNIRLLTWTGPWNWSAINNFAVKEATGDYYLLLNNDTKIITPGWVTEMLMYAQRKDVGAVGAMLYYSDNTVQHAGVIIGLGGGVAGHAFGGVVRGGSGYMGRMRYAQNMSAVTGACMMVRKDVWEEVHGIDESFAVSYNDVDLCMRLRKLGYLIVWTPFAELYHYESKSRGYDTTPEKRARFLREHEMFMKRWNKEFSEGDPYFNPNLSLLHSDFRLKEPVHEEH